MAKNYKLKTEDIKLLVSGMGGCFATDKITVEGEHVAYMYREEPEDDNDSGWRFFAGSEDQDYVDNPNNVGYFSTNTIANYDRAIIPYLDEPIGSEFERINGTDEFEVVE